jgi:hypothetical protein
MYDLTVYSLQIDTKAHNKVWSLSVRDGVTAKMSRMIFEQCEVW